MTKRDEAKEETRAIVIDTAKRLFMRDGFEAVTVRQIGAASMRSSGSIYSSFPSKEALHQHLLETDAEFRAWAARRHIEALRHIVHYAPKANQIAAHDHLRAAGRLITGAD